MSGALLALDQGTTSSKAFRSEHGAWHPIGSRHHRQIRPGPGLVEHDPREVLAHLRELIGLAGTVEAAALANQGETVVAWDALTKDPLGNMIVWQDERTAPEIERLRAAGFETETLARAGLPLDPYFSAAKLRWLLDHADGARRLHDRGRLRLGTSDAFLIDSLTGCFATDVSTASRTSLLDLSTLRWDPELCRGFGVPMECLPEIRPTVGDFGRLASGAVLRAAAVDQQASLYGHGCRHPGEVKITFGTGAFALGLVDASGSPPAGLLKTCAWQIGTDAPRYALDGGILTAGAAVDWMRGLGLPEEIDDKAPSAASRGLFFVPAQAGLGCPYWDRSARGGWIGLGLDTRPGDLCRAVFEGVALRAAQVLRCFEQSGPIRRVSVDGGMTRNPVFVRFLSACLGQPIAMAETPDLTGLGLLALCADGIDAPTAQWVNVVADDAVPADIHRRFEDAVSRLRGWSRPGAGLT